jgi:biopolymer transport protein ExbB
MENFYDYIEKGGIIFSILLILSAIGLTLITYKFIELNFLNDFDLQSFEEDFLKSSNLDDFKQLIDLKPNSERKNFLIETLSIIRSNSSKAWKDQEIETLIHKKYLKSQKFLPSLEIIAQVSPLVGLLGTVIGMIDSFNELELGGSLVDPSILAGGIWTALLTTAMGLIVAIPALISHYFFDKKLTNITQSSSVFLNKLINQSS